ncbi:MAG: helix-hairpin-helix domain-containing protein [Deltaproteobacteria bacterium]|nr:helix-hairpin-helix domain-containing protein [Deltaproteobacteria bacterium]
MKRWKQSLAACVIIAAGMTLGLVTVAQETQKININRASIDQLIELRGIGPILAARIVQYREEHGPFQSPEDIMKVKGIGPKTWGKNRQRITVEDYDAREGTDQ